MTSAASSGPVAVILAAGLGTRMRSRLPKVLHPVCGRPMLAYVIEAARRRPVGRRSWSSRRPRRRSAARSSPGADFALQDEPRGTADAVRAALDVLPADVDRDRGPQRRRAAGDRAPCRRRSLDAAPRGAGRGRARHGRRARSERPRPGGAGRRRSGSSAIVEERDATEEQLDIDEINAGLYAFDVAWLRQRLPDIAPSPVTGELYLPLLVALARADRRPVAALELPDDGTLAGINDRAQLSDAELRDAPAHQRRASCAPA